MTPFHVGMRVVCVDDGWVPMYPNLPVKGRVYEIEHIYQNSQAFSGLTFDLVGIEQYGRCFCSSCFRPAHENRMDELRSLLVPKPSKSKSPSEVA